MLERLQGKACFCVLFAERMWAVIQSSASFAGVDCRRYVVVIKVNLKRIACSNIKDVQISNQTWHRIVQAY